MNKEEYYKFRNFNDFKRIKSFKLEKKFILSYCKKKNLGSSSILDIGSGTGEMLDEFNVNKNKTFCIENSPYAIKILKKKKYNVITLDKIIKKKIIFDMIILRGSIQYLENPFDCLRKLSKILKKNAHLILLQTPNSSSLSFKLNNNLAFLEYGKMYYIPNQNSLVYFLKQINLQNVKFEYPYLMSPYRNVIKDICYLVLNIFGFKDLKYSFPGNIFNAIFKKK